MRQEIVIDDEFKLLIRPLTSAEYRQLEESILKEGCRDALVVWGSTLVDGHHRYEICRKHSIPFKTVEQEFVSRDEAKVWIIDNQFSRRNLSQWDRCVLALKLKDIFRKKAQAQQGMRTDLCQNSDKSFESIDTKRELAKIAEVSHDTIAKAKFILENAAPGQIARLDIGEVSINEIYNEIKKVEKIVLIDIDDLGVDVCNIRGGEWIYDEEFIQDLKNNGFINPLLVRPADPSTGKEYAIVCGYQKYYAAIEVGYTEVPCFIKEMDDVTAMGRSIAENKYSKDVPALCYVKMIGEMKR